MVYDLAIVGGGLGGSTLATVMARVGTRVLVVEREREFRDRNRGEYIHPWGVVEARALDIEARLLETCGHPVPWRSMYAGGALIARRDVTAARGCPGIGFHHPEMQEVLLALARESGAEVRRGVVVTGVRPGTPPSLELEDGERITARLVVAADGRTSRAREWAGLLTLRDPECLVIAGIFHGQLDLPSDSVHTVYEPRRGQGVLIFPVGGERFRSYFFYARKGPPRPLHGARHADDFIAACAETGAPPAWFARARVLGPLASFEACDRWVERPHREGVALIGDAAAATDPTFGDGLSLTLRDVRTLRDRLLGTPDWGEAAEAYAAEHARYYGALRRIQGWTRELLYERGPAAEARRARALPLLAKEPDRRLDYSTWGPEGPSDEAARRRFYAEDAL
jgi:2-polyprenyl-6-methoxyphenol hydroxylase-like FAD-dependent oxidoreductase